MECNRSSLVWSISISLSATLLLLLRGWTKARRAASKQLPPGPPAWPVIGNILNFGSTPHQNLYNLKFKYGSVLWLRLGSVNTMVVQSAKAAEELFKKHDLTFCDRWVSDALTACNYDQGSLAVGKYGTHWRLLRRLCSAELMTRKRIDETAGVRRKCIDKMIKWVEEDSVVSRSNGGTGEVEISRFLFLMGFNLVGNLVLSRDVLDPEAEEGYEFYDAMNKVMEWAGKPNLADFIPVLKPLDPLRIKRNMERDLGRTVKIVSRFVKERIREKESGVVDRVNKDFLDVLLEYHGDGKEGPEKISEHNVTILILDMFLAGSETSSSTLEWAMTELLHSPSSMRKVKEELDRVVGTNRRVEESDMDSLLYLQAVVKETFRLHPAVPLLIPRSSMEDRNYMGYQIPKNTQVLVNVWAFGRDPKSWEDPLSFKPERFMGKNIEFKGQHFELIPFGSGRRICIGYSMAQRVVHLALATLLQTFDWEVDRSNFSTPETIDMKERVGISLRKLVPLKAIPTKRTCLKVK